VYIITIILDITHTWSEVHCLPNSIHPIDVFTGTAAILKSVHKERLEPEPVYGMGGEGHTGE